MDFLSLEHKSSQNLAPTCLSILIFITCFHKLYTPARLDGFSYMECILILQSHQECCSFPCLYVYILPVLLTPSLPGSCPDPSRSDGTFTSIQSIFYFKSCLQSFSLWSLQSRSVLDAYSISLPQSPAKWDERKLRDWAMVIAEQGLCGQSKILGGFVGFGGLSSLKWKKVCPGIGAGATKEEMGDHQDSGSFSDAHNPFPHPHCLPISFSECKQPENSRHLQQTKSSGIGGPEAKGAKGGINLYQYL